MEVLSDNLLFLRQREKLSQQKLANDLTIERDRYAKYERGKSEPPIDILKRIAHYFHVSVDLLISTDLSKVDMEGLLKLEGNRLLLPMKINSYGDNFIEIIPQSAKAGYLTGYSDPEFIEALQYISLPFLKEGKYRAFPIEGDSMPPHKEGSFVVGKYVERISEVKAGKTYVLLTRNEGIVYKRVQRKSRSTLVLSSDNVFYKPYEIQASEILEIWSFASSIATNEYEPDDLSADNISRMFTEISNGIGELKSAVKGK